MTELDREQFHPTSGQFMGWLLVVVAAATIVAAVLGGSVEVALAAAFAALLAWAAMLRPRLLLEPGELVMRNMLETVRIPLAAIEQLVVRQVFAVRTADKRYVSTAVGKSWRKTLVSGRSMEGPSRLSDRAVPSVGSVTAVVPHPESGEATFGEGMHYADFVESRVREAITADRRRRDAPQFSDAATALAADVRREPAWLEIALISFVGVAFVISLLV